MAAASLGRIGAGSGRITGSRKGTCARSKLFNLRCGKPLSLVDKLITMIECYINHMYVSLNVIMKCRSLSANRLGLSYV
jgi:hypothetical protein